MNEVGRVSVDLQTPVPGELPDLRYTVRPKHIAQSAS